VIADHTIYSSTREVVRFEGFSLCRRTERIIELRFDADFHGTVEKAVYITDQLELFTNGNKHPILVIYGEYNSFEPGVREYLAGPDVDRVSLAHALVVKGLALKILGNAYLRINKPMRPTRLFTNEHDALKWLIDFTPN
jgi:hypothetical protein